MEQEAKTVQNTENQTESSPSPKLKFSPAQQKVIDSRGKNLLVSASAGAGKTAVLVERLCRLVVDDHIPISSILAMTFTEDAAREMKTRLKNRLLEAAETDPWLNSQIGDLETAMICTIHSFCLDLVQRDYYMAGLSYTMVNHVDNDLADSQALEEAFEEARLALDPHKSAGLLLYMQAASKNEEHMRERILRFLELAASKPDPEGWMKECRKTSQAILPWFFQYFEVRIQALYDIFAGMVDAVEDIPFARAAKQEEYVQLFSGKMRALELCLNALKEGNYREFGALFIEYLETTGKFTPTINKISFASLQKDSRSLEKEIADVLFTQEQFEECSRQTEEIQNTFIDLALDVRRRFQEIKKREGFIDFSDMELYAWKILQNPEAADALRDKYQVILIDEYQDTNDLQESIINAIARENNVFRVGDIKQSIYGFRQARPQLMKSHLEHPGKHDEIIAMQENYRSTKTLIEFSNDFFSHLMNVDGMIPQFSAIDAARPGTEKQSQGDQKPVRFLFTEYGKGEEGEKVDLIGNRKIHRMHRYDLIAHDILKHVESGKYTLRDIAILTRTSTPHDELKQALEAWGIRAIHHVRKGFYTNKAIQVVLSALRVIQDERNDIALMAVLCSPLTGLSQQDILPLLAGADDSQSLYARLHQNENGYKVLKIVRELKAFKSLSLPEMVVSIYQLHGFYDYSTSSQDKTNLDLLLEKAAAAQSLLDLDGFLDSASLEEDLDKTSEAVPFGKEEDAVRISTIHASKGLQYGLVYILSEQTHRDHEGMSPITFDPDLGLALCGFDAGTLLRQKSAPQLALAQKRFFEEQQEKMRLLYVACTRAEKELVFVDTLKTESDYDWELDRRAILNDRGFTSWFFHVYHTRANSPVVFEKVETLYDRPQNSSSSSRTMKIRRYRGPVESIRSQTASAAKKTLTWPKKGQGKSMESSQAKERGTLFHELVSTLPYPYQSDQIALKASEAGLPITPGDIERIEALNSNETFARWMKLPHEFECPYCVMEDGAVVHGFMDLVVFGDEAIEILDFKTDAAFDEQSLAEKYQAQLETYRQAMHKIMPERKIRAWIYSFDLNSLFELPEKQPE